MNLICMDYKNVAHDTEVPLEDVESVYVRVITGDEVMTVTKTDGTTVDFDASVFEANYRLHDYWDGDYAVHKDDLKQWMERKTTYEWFHVLMERGVADDADV